jgi:hypothetical protein
VPGRSRYTDLAVTSLFEERGRQAFMQGKALNGHPLHAWSHNWGQGERHRRCECRGHGQPQKRARDTLDDANDRTAGPAGDHAVEASPIVPLERQPVVLAARDLGPLCIDAGQRVRVIDGHRLVRRA